MLRVLLICTGNTCRSPMAEILLRDRLQSAGCSDKVKVLSAGLAAGEGSASASAVRVMQKRNLDLSFHQVRQVLPELIEAADLILTMTDYHKQVIGHSFPQARDKVFTLCQFAGSEGEVLDPFGGNDVVYEACAVQIEKLVERSIEKIIHMAGDNQAVEKK